MVNEDKLDSYACFLYNWVLFFIINIYFLCMFIRFQIYFFFSKLKLYFNFFLKKEVFDQRKVYNLMDFMDLSCVFS